MKSKDLKKHISNQKQLRKKDRLNKIIAEIKQMLLFSNAELYETSDFYPENLSDLVKLGYSATLQRSYWNDRRNPQQKIDCLVVDLKNLKDN